MADLQSYGLGGGIGAVVLVMGYKLLKENGVACKIKSQCCPKCWGGDNDDFEFEIDTNRGRHSSMSERSERRSSSTSSVSAEDVPIEIDIEEEDKDKEDAKQNEPI